MYSLKLLPLSPDICYCLLNRIKQILCSHNIFEVLFLLQQVSVSAEGNIRYRSREEPSHRSTVKRHASVGSETGLHLRLSLVGTEYHRVKARYRRTSCA